MKKDSNIVQSLTRGLIGLEYAIEKSEIKPADLANILNIDRSSAYRLLYTLMNMGYIIQNPESKKFLPNSSKFIAIYNKVVHHDDWSVIVSNYLKNLVVETNESSNLAIQDGDSVVYIAQEQSNNAILVHTPLGTRRQIYASALGKAILAFLDEKETEKIVSNFAVKEITPRTITNPEMLLLHLKIVRERGYALDDEESFEGVRCIAAPLFNKNGKVIASMGISGPVNRITTDKISDLAKIVVSNASKATNAIKDLS